MTRNVRHLRLGLLALEGPSVLALLRVILAGEKRPEEAAARLELAATVGALLVGNRREVVCGGDERAGVHLLERLVERSPEILEHRAPADGSVLHLVELLFHARGEADVE